MPNHFHANTHQPGYLPMSDDLPTFETAEEAWSYIESELQRDWDHEYDGTKEGWQGMDERSSIDERFLPAHTAIDTMSRERGAVHVDGPTSTHLGIVYEVTECGLTECAPKD
jgi:hypothetical protein